MGNLLKSFFGILELSRIGAIRVVRQTSFAATFQDIEQITPACFTRNACRGNSIYRATCQSIGNVPKKYL